MYIYIHIVYKSRQVLAVGGRPCLCRRSSTRSCSCGARRRGSLQHSVCAYWVARLNCDEEWCVYICIYMYVCIYIHIHTYVCTHIYIHIYTSHISPQHSVCASWVARRSCGGEWCVYRDGYI